MGLPPATPSPEPAIDMTRTANIAAPKKKPTQAPAGLLPKRKIELHDKRFIQHKSATLMSLPLSKIKNKTLRRLLSIAKSNGIQASDILSDATNVVYAIYHTKTSRFYIGETSKSVHVRFLQHWSTTKVDAGSTELSRFFVNRRMRFPNEDLFRDVRAFVLKKCTSDSERKRSETEIIKVTHAQRVVSHFVLNERVPLNDSRPRLRHRPPNAPPAHPTLVQTRDQMHAASRIATHLSSLNDANRFAALQAMSKTKLKSLNRHYNPKSEAKREVAHVLRNKEYKEHSAKQRDDQANTFVFDWPNRRFDRAKKLLMTCPGYRNNIRLTAKLNPPAGLSVRNILAAAQEPALGSTCMCDQVGSEFKVEGHLCTVEFVKLQATDRFKPFSNAFGLMCEGCNYRAPRYAAASAFEETALRFFNTTNAQKDGTIANLEKRDAWVQQVSIRFMRPSPNTDSSQRPNNPPAFNHQRALAELKELHKNYVIGGCDKNNQQNVLYCRAFYTAKLKEELDKAFEPMLQDKSRKEAGDWITKRMAMETAKVKVTPGKTLPYPYLLVKLHKLDTHRGAFRLIVGKSAKNPIVEEDEVGRDVATPPSSTPTPVLEQVRANLSRIYNSMLDVMQAMDAEREVKKFWVMRRGEDFVDYTIHPLSVDAKRRPVLNMSTADFTTMYTNLPHAALIRRLQEATELVFNFLASRMKVDRKRIVFTREGQWTVKTTKLSVSDWSLDRIKEAIRVSVSNAYILVFGKFMVQTKGVGMGNDDSPGAANIFLSMMESDYVDKMMSLHGPHHIQSHYYNFKYHRRYIDDIFAPVPPEDLPVADDYCGLELKITYSGQKVVYVGIEACYDPVQKEITCKARDKQHAFNFLLLRYPSKNSCVPRSMRVGTIVGMLVRTLRLTTKIIDFRAECRHILNNFRQRQYEKSIIDEGIRKFVNRHLNPAVAKEWCAFLMDTTYTSTRPQVNQAQQGPVAAREMSPPPREPSQQSQGVFINVPAPTVNVFFPLPAFPPAPAAAPAPAPYPVAPPPQFNMEPLLQSQRELATFVQDMAANVQLASQQRNDVVSNREDDRFTLTLQALVNVLKHPKADDVARTPATMTPSDSFQQRLFSTLAEVKAACQANIIFQHLQDIQEDIKKLAAQETVRDIQLDVQHHRNELCKLMASNQAAATLAEDSRRLIASACDRMSDWKTAYLSNSPSSSRFDSTIMERTLETLAAVQTLKDSNAICEAGIKTIRERLDEIATARDSARITRELTAAFDAHKGILSDLLVTLQNKSECSSSAILKGVRDLSAAVHTMQDHVPEERRVAAAQVSAVCADMASTIECLKHVMADLPQTNTLHELANYITQFTTSERSRMVTDWSEHISQFSNEITTRVGNVCARMNANLDETHPFFGQLTGSVQRMLSNTELSIINEMKKLLRRTEKEVGDQALPAAATREEALNSLRTRRASEQSEFGAEIYGVVFEAIQRCYCFRQNRAPDGRRRGRHRAETTVEPVVDDESFPTNNDGTLLLEGQLALPPTDTVALITGQQALPPTAAIPLITDRPVTMLDSMIQLQGDRVPARPNSGAH